jgi:glutathione peroxidase
MGIIAMTNVTTKTVQGATTTAKGFYALEAERITGQKAPLADFAGKVALVVNTASQCGYTPQYKDLQEIYARYEKQGFVVLGFPSNDFGGQEPGTNAEVKKFCEVRFHTTFPLFAKGPVKGKAKQPVYKYLTETGNPDLQGEIDWNFEKFLIDREGAIVARFKSKVSPSSPEISGKIEELLKQR